MSFRIEVLENNTVELFNDTQEAPFIRQPQWPNGEAWADAAQARSWGEMYIEALENAEAPFAPNGPNEERMPKPTAEEIAEWQAKIQNREMGLDPA